MRYQCGYRCEVAHHNGPMQSTEGGSRRAETELLTVPSTSRCKRRERRADSRHKERTRETNENCSTPCISQHELLKRLIWCRNY
ncbi:hypothetical protein NDU88_001072 [Pleurodeles waltl]|uniref:Uncharacterized protein n=1 Tax=Pleurodeles waltl TaxID=8319 RepID=A0AAV7LGG7_PLEWA|nr:hypothetical protein NDU88_001072 [Pleurodeles waltl]